jgi:hypothetical protein
MLSVAFDEPTVILLPGGQQVTGDEVRVRAHSAVFESVSGTKMTVVSAIGIESLAVTDETIGEFGNAHRSLNGAALEPAKLCPNCHLTLGNIGASGDDGVAIEFEAAAAFEVGLSSSDGDFTDRIRIIWDSAVGGDLTSGDVVLQGTGFDQLIVTGDVSLSGSVGGTVEVVLLLDGDVVATLKGPVEDPPVVITNGLSKPRVRGVGAEDYLLRLAGSSKFDVLDLDGNLIATVDEIRYACTDPFGPQEVVVGAQIRGLQPHAIEIVQETLTPLDACLADCDDNGVLNILDFVCYQNLFKTGDLAADCDGNNLLNILDFVCYQNAFKVGCP